RWWSEFRWCRSWLVPRVVGSWEVAKRLSREFGWAHQGQMAALGAGRRRVARADAAGDALQGGWGRHAHALAAEARGPAAHGASPTGLSSRVQPGTHDWMQSHEPNGICVGTALSPLSTPPRTPASAPAVSVRSVSTRSTSFDLPVFTAHLESRAVGRR